MLHRRMVDRLHLKFKIKKSIFVGKLSLILCFVSYFLGLVIGAINGVGIQDRKGYFQLFIEQYLSVHLTNSIWEIWQMDFLSTLFLLSVLLFSALSCVGTPIIFFLPAIRGMFTGLLTACLYTQEGIKGILLNGLTFLIPNTGIAIVMILFATECSKSSIEMMKHIAQQEGCISKISVKQLCWKFFLSGAMVLLFCFIQAILLAIFGPLFL